VAADAPTSTRPSRLGWWSSLAGSALLVHARPGLVALALAGFLARGGILAILFPIVVLPTPAGLANVFAPFIVQLYFGHVSEGVVLLVGSVIGVAVAWLVLGGAIGAAADVTLIRAAAHDDELGDIEASPGSEQIAHGMSGPGARRESLIWRALAIRLLAHAPLVIALAWGASRIYQATYAELTSPFEVVTPLIARILGDVPDVISAVVFAWLLGEVAGGLGVRFLVLGERPFARALIAGWFHIVRHPVATATTMLATDIALAAALVAAFAAAGAGWGLVQVSVFDTSDLLMAMGSVVALVGAWLAGLSAIGLATCWRSVAWTAEWLRIQAARDGAGGAGRISRVGTIGGGSDVRPGDWSSADPSGTV
jgi:hypothetical protein